MINVLYLSFQYDVILTGVNVLYLTAIFRIFRIKKGYKYVFFTIKICFCWGSHD
jgi:hypothetical protein